MKNFKVLFMLAGLSSVVSASDLPNDSFLTKAVQVISENADKAANAARNLAQTISDNASTYLASTPEVVATPVVETITEAATASPVTENYMAQLYSKLSEFGASVSTKAFDITTYVVKSGSELGASVAKNASEFGTQVSTKTSEMTTASVKFVEDNQTAVIISATVATTLALTALVRYNMYGYVFYSSAKAEDKN
jgi:hypothetical protein